MTMPLNGLNELDCLRIIAGNILAGGLGGGGPSGAPNNQSGATYTPTIDDKNKLVRMTSGSANTFTIPPNSSVAYPVTSTIYVEQAGAGATTIAGGAGVTVNGVGGSLTIGAQYGTVTLLQVATDAWIVTGIPVNLHAPGPIGDVTPATLAGTTLTIASTATTQSTVAYDIATKFLATQIDSVGNILFALTGTNGNNNLFEFRINGNDTFLMLDRGNLLASGAGACYGFTGTTPTAGRVRFSVSSANGAGNGLSDAGGSTALGFAINAVDIATLDASFFTTTVPVKVPGGTSPLIATSSAVTSGGAAAIGTLTNAPTAGNPAVWAPVLLNGVTRYMPLW